MSREKKGRRSVQPLTSKLPEETVQEAKGIDPEGKEEVLPTQLPAREPPQVNPLRLCHAVRTPAEEIPYRTVPEPEGLVVVPVVVTFVVVSPVR